MRRSAPAAIPRPGCPSYRNFYRGVPAMKTSWRLIGLYAILAAALTAAPVVAADSDVPKSKDLADVQKQLDRIEASLGKVQGLKVDVDELRERVQFQRTVI